MQAATSKLERKSAQRAMLQTKFHMAQHADAQFSITLPADWDYEDTLNPEFWVNIQPMLKYEKGRQEQDFRKSRIHVHREDASFYAVLYIRAIVDGGLVVQCIGPSFTRNGKPCPIDLETGLPWAGNKEQEKDSPYAIKWNFGRKGYDVIRNSDREIVADGSKIKTREQAQAWVEEALKAA